MASLAEIRAKLQAADTKAAGKSGGGGDKAIYPHWDIEENASVSVRFLPDADPKNTYFWVERAIIKLLFNGILGESDAKQITVQVPCVEMWGETCPILTEVRPWFKDKTLEDMGRRYWKKRSYLFQGFVRDNPITDDETPENPIRRFIIGPQIFTLIKAALMDPEIDNIPTDYVKGLDFRMTKTTKGGYADYNTSSWARKETALTEAELAAIDKYGLFNLADFLPNKPGAVELKVMQEMFEASVDGKPYDAARWGQYYRPYGLAVPAGAKSTPVADTKDEDTVAASSKVEALAKTVAAPTAPVEGGKAADILALIRSRQAKPE